MERVPAEKTEDVLLKLPSAILKKSKLRRYLQAPASGQKCKLKKNSCINNMMKICNTSCREYYPNIYFSRQKCLISLN